MLRGKPMKGSRPAQGALTEKNDLSKTNETRRVVELMVDGLNDHEIDGMREFFHQDFRWIGNAGCGLKEGLKAFQEHWQRPFQQAFSDKVCIDEARLCLLYTSPSPRDRTRSRMPSSA